MLLVIWLCPALARAQIPLPMDDGMPVRVAPSLLVDRVTDINDRDNSFTAEISLAVEWTDGRLAFDPVAEARDAREYLNEAATAELAKSWSPRIEVVNLAEPARLLSTTLVVRYNGRVRLTRHMAARTRMEFDLSDYPFDRQALTWQIASAEYGREAVVLVTEPARLPPGLVIKGWAPERITQATVERPGITGRPFSTVLAGLVVDRQSYVAVTQIFLPYLAIMFLPLICLFNVGPNTPMQLFTALLALLTLNFKIVLEEPVIASVSNAVVDGMWMGYFYIGLSLLLALTVMRPADERRLSDTMLEVRQYCKWGPPVVFLVTVAGRVAAAA
jgi:hypothetical protein